MFFLPSTVHEVPFVRLFIPLLLGALVAHYVLPDAFSFNGLTLPLILLFLLTVGLAVFPAGRLPWYGVVLNLFLLSAGMALLVSARAVSSLRESVPADVVVRIEQPLLKRARTYRCEATLIALCDSSENRIVSERIMLYFSLTDSASTELNRGDIVACRILPRCVPPATNPYQFSYADYLWKTRGIRLSAFVPDHAWMLCSPGRGVRRWADSIRLLVTGCYRNSGIVSERLAVLSAVTLGYRDWLDEKTRQVFARAGVSHVLAVSGLHVGLVFLVVSMGLFFLPSSAPFRWLRGAVILGALWFFAVIAGLTPSVTRSAFMFSLVAVGQALNARINIVNTLAAAAFVLVVANPLTLFSLGFHLSFLAVLSIAVFYPKISALFVPESKPIRYCWSLVAVSLAVQPGTLPLILYHFGAFPLLFIVSNLWAIPLVSLVLYLAVLFILFIPVPPVHGVLGYGIDILLRLLSRGLDAIARIPYSTIQGIELSGWQLALLMAASLLLALYLYTRKRMGLNLMLLMLLLALIPSVRHSLHRVSPELVVFDLPDASLSVFSFGGKARIVDYGLPKNKTLTDYSVFTDGYLNIRHRGAYSAIRLTDSLYLSDAQLAVWCKSGLALLQFGPILAAIPYSDSVGCLQAPSALPVDILLLNSYFHPNLLAILSPDTVIIDRSANRSTVERFLNIWPKGRGTLCNLRETGAYRQPISP